MSDGAEADADARHRKLVHDLRTPVTVIGGFTELLISRGEQLPADKRAEYLRRVDEAVREMRAILDAV